MHEHTLCTCLPMIFAHFNNVNFQISELWTANEYWIFDFFYNNNSGQLLSTLGPRMTLCVQKDFCLNVCNLAIGSVSRDFGRFRRRTQDLSRYLGNRLTVSIIPDWLLLSIPLSTRLKLMTKFEFLGLRIRENLTLYRRCYKQRVKNKHEWSFISHELATFLCASPKQCAWWDSSRLV